MLLEERVMLFVLELPCCPCWAPFHLFQLLLHSFSLQLQTLELLQFPEPPEWCFLQKPTLSLSVLQRWMWKVCPSSEGSPAKSLRNTQQTKFEIYNNIFLFHCNYCLLGNMPTDPRWAWALPIGINSPWCCLPYKHNQTKDKGSRYYNTYYLILLWSTAEFVRNLWQLQQKCSGCAINLLLCILNWAFIVFSFFCKSFMWFWDF